MANAGFSDADSTLRESHGRKYHNTGSNYGLPSDAEEFHRLDIQHASLKIVCGGNYVAPIHSIPGGPKFILDLCCGSGIWVVEMAKEFPESRVVGFDLVVPALSMDIPPNARFVAGDATGRLPFEDASFDFVQMRVTPSLFERMAILRELGRILRPGGLVAFGEPGSTTRVSGERLPAMKRMGDMIIRLPHSAPKSASSNQEKEYDLPQKTSWSIASIMRAMIQQAKDAHGNLLFTDVEEKEFRIPIGPWSTDVDLKRAGELQAENQVLLLDGFRPPLLENGITTDAELDELRAAVAAEVYDPALEIKADFVWAWGRRAA